MGSVHTKETNITSTNTITQPQSDDPAYNTPVKLKNKHITDVMNPLQKTFSNTPEDPRSPASRRTPFQSPNSTPTLSSKQARERMLMKFGAVNFTSLDPRSPSIASRTPIHLSSAEAVPRTPPLSLSGCDPRSPCVGRTPLALSTYETVIVPDDFAIIGHHLVDEVTAAFQMSEQIIDNAIDSAKMHEKQRAEGEGIAVSMEEVEVDLSSIGRESMSERVTTETYNSSPEMHEVSAAILAMAVISPLNSPSLVSRRRRDLIKSNPAVSPLKKSWSAPIPDENTSPNASPSLKSKNASSRPRAPLSPLTQRAINSRHCMGVQPIKFRMDPGILG